MTAKTTAKKPKLVGAKVDIKASKKPKNKVKPIPLAPPAVKTTPIVKSTIVWEDAYPCIEETYRVNDELVKVEKYISAIERPLAEYEKFLFEIIRSTNVPTFVKNNFKKIKKNIEKEIQHRSKLAEKMTKEQKVAFFSYFKDEDYFNRTHHNEYFEHEVERVYVDYLKAYFDTGMYESHVRLANKVRREQLKQHGIIASNG